MNDPKNVLGHLTDAETVATLSHLMTPEQRARAWGSYDGTSMEEQLANCIRAAENDALERVAVHCDQEAAEADERAADERADRSPDLVEGGYSSAYQEAAAFVRSLKHK